MWSVGALGEGKGSQEARPWRWGRGRGLPEHNAVVFDEHVDIGAVLNTKLHEHILGPVVPQGPSMLPEEELRWGFIGVREGRLRAFGKGRGKYRVVLCYSTVKAGLNKTEGGGRGGTRLGCTVKMNLRRTESARVER